VIKAQSINRSMKIWYQHIPSRGVYVERVGYGLKPVFLVDMGSCSAGSGL